MQEGVSLEWWFWFRPIHILELVQLRVDLRSHMEEVEEFCKPQSNEVQARFDLLTSFRQGDMSVDEWYNAVQTQVALAKYPQETAQML